MSPKMEPIPHTGSQAGIYAQAGADPHEGHAQSGNSRIAASCKEGYDTADDEAHQQEYRRVKDLQTIINNEGITPEMIQVPTTIPTVRRIRTTRIAFLQPLTRASWTSSI